MILLLAACFGTSYDEEDISAALADAFCTRQKDCARGTYEAIYFGDADCRRQNGVSYDALVEGFGACDYHIDEAEEAVDRLYDLDCGAFFDGAYIADYSEIWTGCVGGGGGGGPTASGATGT